MADRGGRALRRSQRAQRCQHDDHLGSTGGQGAAGRRALRTPLPLRLAHQKTDDLPRHGAVVCLGGGVPRGRPQRHRLGGMAAGQWPQPHRRDGAGAGRLVHQPPAHLGRAHSGLLSPHQWRGAAQRRHPAAHPGLDRRARCRCLVAARRGGSVATGLSRPGRAMAQRHRHDGRVV